MAVKKVLATNNAILTAKIEKSAEKYINEIFNKSKKKIIAKKKIGC